VRNVLTGCQTETRNNYALPKVTATRRPRLDAYIKSELSQNTKASDKELATVQTFVLDAVSPLMKIVEADTKGDNISHKQAVSAAKVALVLIGNASARINHLRS